MRLFVAVDLSDEARHAIAAEQKRIAAALAQSHGSIRLVRPEHLHLTLVFLGDVQEARAPFVVEAMNIGVDMPAFEIAFDGSGVFPPRGAPRALWIGVTDGAAALVDLQQRIRSRCGPLGIALEAWPFAPHLTLARWRESRSSDRAKAMAAGRRGEIAHVRVGRATLYQSCLSSAGPTYTPLAHATLSADNKKGLGAGG